MRKFHWFDDGRPKSNQKVSKQRLTGRNGHVWRLLWLKVWKLWGFSRWDAMFWLWHAMPVTWASQFIKSLFKALPNLLKSSTSTELFSVRSSFWQASLIHLFEGRQTNGMKQSGACFRWRHVRWRYHWRHDVERGVSLCHRHPFMICSLNRWCLCAFCCTDSVCCCCLRMQFSRQLLRVLMQVVCLTPVWSFDRFLSPFSFSDSSAPFASTNNRCFYSM